MPDVPTPNDPEPYVRRNANDLIRAADWNNIQIEAIKGLRGHNHTGAAQGVKLTGDAIDPASSLAVANLTVRTRKILDEIDALTARTGKLEPFASAAFAADNVAVAKGIELAHSDIYFSGNDHAYTDDLGAKPGWASIQNDGRKYNALMILGRKGDKGRLVSVWDDLTVDRSLKVGGRDILAEIDKMRSLALPRDTDGAVALDEKELRLRSISDNNHVLRWAGGRGFAGPTIDGPALYGFTGGVLGTTQDPAPGKSKERIALQWDSAGRIGIGVTPPGNRVDIANATRTATHGKDLALYVTSDSQAAGGGVEFRHSNASQGIGFGYCTIYATGSNADQDLVLQPRGNGSLKVTGGAITPTAGTGRNNGIFFPENPGGGSGDAAWLRYFPRTGEACTLELGISNDGDDDIFLNAAGSVIIGCVDRTDGKIQAPSSQDKSGGFPLLQIRREAGTRTGGKGAFLELFQDDASPAVVPFVYPYIRFHHRNRFTNRLEGRDDGLHVMGHWSTDDHATCFAREFKTASDAALKADISPIQKAAAVLDRVQPVRFRWRSDGPAGRMQIGVVAQDVEAVLPELVATGSDGMKTVDYGGLTAVLLGILHEQRDELSAIKSRLGIARPPRRPETT